MVRVRVRVVVGLELSWLRFGLMLWLVIKVRINA